ncbi:tryptophan synthase subunit alpha [Chryseobacterium salipaludis]|uniref:tryptophan synthase subunit alpha n=1 Tax=Chryseobacterium TaxID=59732 RepID=UPI001FF48B56|nr:MULTISPECIES: tryptophan synthase subunit alpha [Chryseobacterium]MCJ8497962.1 tryptophan synthase subunit alpha [Chryseobacterium salipaludis]MCX3296839.1 tryptophan synthase subunit alpha [Planobacterium sp. JC490]
MKKKKLNIYFTAGIPQLNDTGRVLQMIQDSGADYVEIGMPYSDPVADGPVIQRAHEKALANGMTISILFSQLKEIRDRITIPVILMGYLNPVLQYGFENFCREARDAGVQGLIIPDLPPVEFERAYKKVTEQYQLDFIFLITPETSVERIYYLDKLGSGFLYAVSSSSTTGQQSKQVYNENYLNRLQSLPLKNEIMVGFGISNCEDFKQISAKVDGAIIGSAFVKILLDDPDWETSGAAFIENIRN